MSRKLRDIRIVPIVLAAAGCLFVLKVTGLWFDGGYTLGQRLTRGESITVTTLPASQSVQLQVQSSPLQEPSARPSGQRSWAQEVFNYPDVTGSVASKPDPRETVIVTGSAGAAKDSQKEAPKESAEQAGKQAKDDAKDKPAPKDAAKVETPAPAKPGQPGNLRAVSSSERAILERLLERRQELEARAREIELRENLLKAAEKNLEEKLTALKAKEAGPGGRRDEAEAARFKGLVTMYETMKPKEAAKIFDRLDLKVLVDVAGQINPRRMSEIMAQMSPEVAERLTMEFATRDTDKGQKPADLPKIDGKPSGG